MAIDLANTVMVIRAGGEEVDLLGGAEDLRRWLELEMERIGDHRFLGSDLEAVRPLRDALRRLFVATARGEPLPHEPLAILNSASEADPIAPLLKADSGGLPIIVERPVGGDPLRWLLGQLARSGIAVLAGPERHDLHLCLAPSCGMVYVGPRRWCSPTCGNRARVAQHYERTRRPAADC